MRKSPLLPIFLIVLVDVLALTIMIPLLPFYAEKLGASPREVGFLTASFSICQLISGPFLGALSDRTGRKPLLVVSQIGTFIGLLIMAYANTLWMVFVSRIIDGITAGNLSLAQAYIADVTEPQNRAKAFGVIGVSFGIGFLLGPAISGYLSQYGYQTPVFAAAGLSLTSIFATLFLLPKVDRSKSAHESVGSDGRRLSFLQWGTYARYFGRSELGILLWQFFMFCMAFGLFISGFALFAERRYTIDGMAWGPREVGYVYAFTGFLGIILQGGLIGRLVKRFGEHKLVRAGFLAKIVGYAILAFSRGNPGLLTAASLTSFGHSTLRPALTSLITQRVGAHEQGMVLGLTQSLNSISMIIAPLISGFLIEHRQLEAWALGSSVMALIGLGLARRRPNEAHPA